MTRKSTPTPTVAPTHKPPTETLPGILKHYSKKYDKQRNENSSILGHGLTLIDVIK